MDRAEPFNAGSCNTAEQKVAALTCCPIVKKVLTTDTKEMNQSSAKAAGASHLFEFLAG